MRYITVFIAGSLILFGGCTLRNSQLTRKEVIKIIRGSPEYHSLRAEANVSR